MPSVDVKDDEALVAYARRVTRTMQHPTSTCAIGIGPGAVVDPQLRVRSIDGLRVIDASVMPVIVGSNTNAATIMIGEKGADLITGKEFARQQSEHRM
jgi:choline dehydrogenase